jgi:hypothetical protein
MERIPKCMHDDISLSFCCPCISCIQELVEHEAKVHQVTAYPAYSCKRRVRERSTPIDNSDYRSRFVGTSEHQEDLITSDEYPLVNLRERGSLLKSQRLNFSCAAGGRARNDSVHVKEPSLHDAYAGLSCLAQGQ